MSEIDFGPLMVEIFDGVSEIDSPLGKLYFKHFSFAESKKILINKAYHEKKALSLGLSKEKDIVDYLIKDKIWDKESEKFIQDKRLFIENLKKSLSKIQIPSQRENHRKLIEMEETKLSEKEQERKELIGITAESYADNKTNSDFLNSFMYVDKDMTKLLADEIDYNDSIFSLNINQLQADFFKKFSDTAISKLVLSDDFSPLFSFVEDPRLIFGKPMIEMTAFQIKLCSYGKTFLNIFKNTTKDIPNYVAKDPDLLIEFYEAQKNETNKNSKAKQGSGGTTYFGANKNDINMMANKDETQVSLSEEIKKRGGKIGMEEMMKLHGV